VQLVQVENRTVVDEILAAHEYVDLLIPRGGASLIKMVRENATMPTLTGGIGVCHIYVDSSADPVMAVDIVVNSKTRRFSTCNELDTLVIHEHAVAAVLPMLAASLADKQTQLRCDAASFETVRQGANVAEATAADFGKEWLSPVLSVKTVRSHEEALEFIQTHSSGHSDGIITNDYALAQQFCSDVDSGVIYVNASTQFTDGAQFGMGAEIIDSTQKMHARGPVGLREICTHKWIAEGNGQLRS
jgi:glutamate-5-semialdehyde dehydrogenase